MYEKQIEHYETILKYTKHSVKKKIALGYLNFYKAMKNEDKEKVFQFLKSKHGLDKKYRK